MHKFADDVDLITTIDHYDEIENELEHVGAWADKNNLLLNKSKIRKMVICEGRTVILPPPTVGIERVNSMKKLGFTIQSNLSMKDHIDKLMTKSSNMIYAMNILRNHGMQGRELQQIYNSKILSRIMYASPAWYGMASKEDKKGSMPSSKDRTNSDYTRKTASKNCVTMRTRNKEPVMHKFVPETKINKYELRKREHNFKSPDKDDRKFINRLLYENK